MGIKKTYFINYKIIKNYKYKTILLYNILFIKQIKKTYLGIINIFLWFIS